MSDQTRVRVALGYTVNMKDYESLRVDFDITDSLRHEETVSEATERIYKFVEKKLVEKVKEVKKELE